MKDLKKFNFDQLQFDASNPEVNSPKSYEIGHKAGFDEGYQKAKAEDEAAIATVMQQATSQMSQLMQVFLQSQQSLKEESLKTAYAITSRLFPYFAENGAYQEILSIIEEGLKNRPEDLTYTVVIHDSLVEKTKAKIKEYAAADFDEGFIKIKGDPDIAVTDCKITWNTGGLERTLSRLQSEIDRAVGRLLTQEDILEIKNIPKPEATQDNDENIQENPQENIEDKLEQDTINTDINSNNKETE